MKETYADELKGKNIRITSEFRDGIPLATQLVITRLDTGERIENVIDVTIEAKPGHIIWATIILMHIDNDRKQILREAVCLENPQLDIVARPRSTSGDMNADAEWFIPTY